MVKISKKFQKKAIDKQGSTKLFKISLEYYEAHFLEQFLQACNVFPYSNTIQSVINILDQKLV